MDESGYSALFVPHTQLGTGGTASPSSQYFGSYAINTYYNGGNANAGQGPTGKTLAQINDPARTMWVTEHAARADDGHAGRLFTNGGGQGNYGAAIAERHLDTVNNLFIDGHVKSLKLNALVARGSLNGAASSTYARFTLEEDD